MRMRHMRRWLGALLAPADDPRPRQSMPEERVGSADADALLGELRRSRDELSSVRHSLQARLDETPEPQRERLELQLRELAAEEQQLLQAEHNLRLAVD